MKAQLRNASRFRRPALVRTAPQRNFRGIFGAPEPARRRTNSPETASGARTVPAGVDLGYRVIEEYLQEGQQFARAMFSRGEGGEHMPRMPIDDSFRMNERLVRYASGLASAWLEYVQAWGAFWPRAPSPQQAATGRFAAFDLGGAAGSRAATGAPAPQHASDANNDNAQDGAEHYMLEIELLSKQRVSVGLDIKPGLRSALCAHELRAALPKLPNIAAPAFEVLPRERRIVMQLAVPDDQPAGVYNALVLDSNTNLPCGTLSVRVMAA